MFKRVSCVTEKPSLLPFVALPDFLPRQPCSIDTYRVNCDFQRRLTGSEALRVLILDFNQHLMTVQKRFTYGDLLAYVRTFSMMSERFFKISMHPEMPSHIIQMHYNMFSCSENPYSTRRLLAKIVFDCLPRLSNGSWGSYDGHSIQKEQLLMFGPQVVSFGATTKGSLGRGSSAKVVSVQAADEACIQKKQVIQRWDMIEHHLSALGFMIEAMQATDGGLESLAAIKYLSRTTIRYKNTDPQPSESRYLFQTEVHGSFVLYVPPASSPQLFYARDSQTFYPVEYVASGLPSNPERTFYFYGQHPCFYIITPEDVTHRLQYCENTKTYELFFKMKNVPRLSLFQPKGDTIPVVSTPEMGRKVVLDLFRNLIHASDNRCLNLDMKMTNVMCFWNRIRQIDFGGCPGGDYAQFFSNLLHYGTTGATLPSPELVRLSALIHQKLLQERIPVIQNCIGQDIHTFIFNAVTYQTAMVIVSLLMTMPLPDIEINGLRLTKNDIFNTINMGLSFHHATVDTLDRRLNRVVLFIQLNAEHLFGPQHAAAFSDILCKCLNPNPLQRPTVEDLVDFDRSHSLSEPVLMEP